ncbi:hypothetical protein ACWDTG_26485, partial [Rhodococcus zopfii]
GLYLTATVHDIAEGSPNRILGGVDLYPFNCATGWGTWDVDPCADPGSKLKYGQRAAPDDPFAALQVWGYDECSPDEPEDDIVARAHQNLRLHEQILAETHFAARLLADAGTPTTVTGLVAALGELEAQIGETGTAGTIHLSQRYAAALDAAGVIVGTGPIPRTRLGNALAFGGGYESTLGAVLVATGAVTVWRSPIFQQTTVSAEENLRAAIAERTVVVGYECLVGAVEIGGTP